MLYLGRKTMKNITKIKRGIAMFMIMALMMALPTGFYGADFVYGKVSDTFDADGYTYTITSKEHKRVNITGLTPSATAMDNQVMKIPGSVKYNGEDYDVVEIEDNAFSGSNPSHIDFSSCTGLKVIGEGAFISAAAMSIDFSNCESLEIIKKQAFKSSNPDELDFSDCSNLIRIDYEAFYSAKASNINISKSIEEIGASAFFNSTPSKLDFFNCSKLKTIGGMAFNEATNSSADFSNCVSLKEIGASTFLNCDFKELDFSSCINLERLGESAFGNSRPDTVILNSPNMPTVGNNIFAPSGNEMQIWYPREYATNYANFASEVSSLGISNFTVEPYYINIPTPSKPLSGYSYGTSLKNVEIPMGGTTISEINSRYTGKWSWENENDIIGYGENKKIAIFKLDKNGLIFGKTTVTIIGPDKPADPTRTISIKTAQKKLFLKKGQSAKLPLMEYTNDGKKTKLTYKSSKPQTISVTQTGKIKAKKIGKSVITVKSSNGKSLKYTVYSVKKATKVKSLKVKYSKNINSGSSKYLKVTVNPKKATNAIATFKSSKPGVLSVDKAGKLTAKKKGKAKITVKVGKKKKVVTITVK